MVLVEQMLHEIMYFTAFLALKYVRLHKNPFCTMLYGGMVIIGPFFVEPMEGRKNEPTPFCVFVGPFFVECWAFFIHVRLALVAVWGSCSALFTKLAYEAYLCLCVTVRNRGATETRSAGTPTSHGKAQNTTKKRPNKRKTI